MVLATLPLPTSVDLLPHRAHMSNSVFFFGKTQLQRIVRGRAVRRMAEIEESRSKDHAASWMAAVAVQRLWRGIKGRKLGQVSTGQNLFMALIGV